LRWWACGITKVCMGIQLGKYRHFKGMEYEVVDVAKCSETLNEFVVYRALYGEKGLWIRPLKMFLETVERDGELKQRFEFVGN